MNLKNIFGSNKNQPPAEYFLAVEIHESLIKSVCWELSEGEPKITGQGSFEMWEDEESLINGVDASITEAVKNIKPEPHRIIFGLPESWLGDEGIHSTKKNLISRIIQELKLEPIGVVPTTQAIAQYLKQKEGIPPTAILLEIFTSKIVVSVVKLGKVEATEEVGVSGDLARDVEEGLARMEFDRLPARFLLTDGGNLEDEQQQILAYPWQERLSFVHMPKVEILPVDLSIRAIALAGGTEAAQHLGLEVKVVEETPPEIIEEQSNIYTPDVKPETDLEKLGFVFEETSPPEEIPEQSDIIHEPDANSPIKINEMPFVSEEAATFAIQGEGNPTPKPKINIKVLIPKLSFLKQFKFPSLSYKLPIAAAVIVLLFLCATSAVYLFTGKATVTVYVTPQKFTHTFQLAIAEKEQQGITTLIAQKKSVSGSAQESTPTTGEATVGDKASGSITIANKSSGSITLKPGTPIISDSGNYKFILDTAVTVASPSADDIVKAQLPKTTGVKVTASKIGAELNIGKDTTFSVDNYPKSSLYAIAENDFSGGTSRTVKAVDKSDQEKVLGLATDKIKEQTSSQLTSQDPGTASLPLNDLHFTEKKFSQGIGEEASDVKINLVGAVELLVYSKQELFDLIKKELSPKVPSGLSFTPETTEIKLTEPTKKGDSYLVNASVDATLFQEISQSDYSKLLGGKSISQARQFLQSISGFTDAKAITSPPIPFLSTSYLPFSNISIEVIPR